MGLTHLDAGVLIGFLNAEDAHHDSAAKAIGDALSANQKLAMSASVLAEILVGPSRSGAKAVEVVRNMVATLPIELVMKNCRIDCAWAMPNAEVMVPSRLAAPPNTTTMKLSTM